MANQNSFHSRWAPRVLSILRIVAGFLLLQHGLQKVFGVLLPPGPAGEPQAHGTFTLLSRAGISGILEFGGGVLLILGLFTRPVAFILSGLLAVAYFWVHAPRDFWPLLNMGELAALYSFVFLYLSVAGGGTWSVDNLITTRR